MNGEPNADAEGRLGACGTSDVAVAGGAASSAASPVAARWFPFFRPPRV